MDASSLLPGLWRSSEVDTLLQPLEHAIESDRHVWLRGAGELNCHSLATSDTADQHRVGRLSLNRQLATGSLFRVVPSSPTALPSFRKLSSWTRTRPQRRVRLW